MEVQEILIKTEPLTFGAHEHDDTADRVFHLADDGLGTGNWSSCVIQQLQVNSGEASVLQNAALESDVKVQTVSSLEGQTLIAGTDLVFSNHGVAAWDGVSVKALQTEMGTSAIALSGIPSHTPIIGVCDGMSESAVQTEVNASLVSGYAFSQNALQTDTPGIAGFDESGIQVTAGYPTDPAYVKLETGSPAYDRTQDAPVDFRRTQEAFTELTETNSEGTVNTTEESSTKSQIRIYESSTGLILLDVEGITNEAQPEDLLGNSQDSSAIPTGLYKNVYVKEEPEYGTGIAFASPASGPCVDFESCVVGVNADDCDVQTVPFPQVLSVSTKKSRWQRSAPSTSTVSNFSKLSPVKVKGSHQDTEASVKKITECSVKLVRLPDGMLSRSGIFRVPCLKDPQLETIPVDLSNVKTEDAHLSSFFHEAGSLDDLQDSTPMPITDDSKDDLRAAVRRRLQSAVGSSRKRLMKLHQSQSKRSASGPRRYFCNTCGRGYKTASGCSQHKKVHMGLKEHKCQVCGKCFMYKSTLTKHMDIHADIRPYPCPLCSKAFRWSSHLKMHLGRHSSERPYVCEECGMRFKQTDNLQNHMITHSRLRPWKCSDCEESFKTKSALKLHTRRHTGEKPYQCQLCSAAFSHANTLVAHMRGIHTGERPYKCSLCPATFTQSTHLRIHVPIHSDPKREARLRRALQRKESGQSSSGLSRLLSQLKKSASKAAQRNPSKISASNSAKKNSGRQGVSKGAAKPSPKKTPKQSTVNPLVKSVSKAKSSEPKSSRRKGRPSGKLEMVRQTPDKSQLVSEGHDHLSNSVLESSTSVSDVSEMNAVRPGVLEDSATSEVHQFAIPSASAPGCDPSAQHTKTESATSVEEDPAIESVLTPAASPRQRSKLGGASQKKSNPDTDLQSASNKDLPGARGRGRNASSQKRLKPTSLPALTKVDSLPPRKKPRTDSVSSSRPESESSPSARSKTDWLPAGGSKTKRLPPTMDSLPMTVLFYRPLLLQAVQRNQQRSGQTGASNQTTHGGSSKTHPENDAT